MVGSRWLPAQVLLPLTARTAGVRCTASQWQSSPSCSEPRRWLLAKFLASLLAEAALAGVCVGTLLQVPADPGLWHL